MESTPVLSPASHPLRRKLAAPRRPRVAHSNQDSDLKLFVVSFTAFFICFYTFLF